MPDTDLRADLASTELGKGAALVVLPTGRNVTDKLAETVSLRDKGADPTGVADSNAAFVAALASAARIVGSPGDMPSCCQHISNVLNRHSSHAFQDGIDAIHLNLVKNAGYVF